MRLFRGLCEGRVTREPRGRGGFGYDPLFFYPPLHATFAELEEDEKNQVSHRGRAFRSLAAFLSSAEGWSFMTRVGGDRSASGGATRG